MACVVSLFLAPVRAAENPAAPAPAEPGEALAGAEKVELFRATDEKFTSENPYRRLTLRNAFGIKPPPEPAPEPPVAVSNPPVALPIFVTGFSLLQGVKKVYLVVNRPGSKAPEYHAAREGEEFDGFQVLNIDPKMETVKVMNAGTKATLDFKNNGMKPVANSTVPGGPIPTPVGRPMPAPAGGNAGATIIGGRGNSSGVITGGAGPQPVLDAGPGSGAFSEVRGRGSVITGGAADTIPASGIAPVSGYSPGAAPAPVVPVPRTRPAPPPPPLPQ
jgi:hypothetical protein